MLNLLVATFTSTYFEIEGSSTYFWSYQRYEMIQECVDRPPVAPPFTLIWYAGEIILAAIQRMLGQCPGLDDFEPEITDDPFCRNFSSNSSLESKLKKWEFMKAQNVLRFQMDSDLPVSRRTEATRGGIAATRSFKGSGGGGGAGRGATAVIGGGGGGGEKLLEDVSSIFGPDSEFIEDKFNALNAQVEKIGGFEERLERIVVLMKRMAVNLKKVQRSAAQAMKSLTESEGRRIVGASRSSTPRTPKTPRQVIRNAITEAVQGLASHCHDIEEKIEEKVRIESLCVKAVLTHTDASEIAADVVAVPLEPSSSSVPSRRPEAAPPSARVLERLIASHRLWRLLPSHFERRPGMRVNIPDRLVSWKVPYPDYRPFVSNSERIAYPFPEAEDGPQIDPTKLQYNAYDELQGVSRCCLQGRVHISRAPSMPRGLPLNPRGRSGLSGKGLLPHWGPNHVIVLAFTRAGAAPTDFKIAVIERDQCFCLPWFFVDHREFCDMRSCSARVLREYLLRRANKVFGGGNPGGEAMKTSLIEAINHMEISLIYDDFLDDHLNADHAWVEAVFVNFHSKEPMAFQTESTKLFLEEPPVESCRWFDFKGSINLRPSHGTLLSALLQHHSKA